jgi:hypothetical protein
MLGPLFEAEIADLARADAMSDGLAKEDARIRYVSVTPAAEAVLSHDARRRTSTMQRRDQSSRQRTR